MSRTYRAIGINLKGMPFGETDRLLTILTPEFGLLQAIAPGARKHKSSLGGRSEPFVVNHLTIVKGRSLDKIIQAETQESYPGLSQDLSKLMAGQYLAELVLCQALSDQPQEALFSLLCEHLRRLEKLPKASPPTPALEVLALLTHAIFHLLALGGVAPQVHHCCISQEPLEPDFTDPQWQVGFSITAGGIVSLEALERLRAAERAAHRPIKAPIKKVAERGSDPQMGGDSEPDPVVYCKVIGKTIPTIAAKLNALELAKLQKLAQSDLPKPDVIGTDLSHNDADRTELLQAWLTLERILRQYAQYHFDRPIRSAALIEACFQSLPTSS
ncbi:MAG: DNA repair protein RecO [Leptolyngbyaceae cyanobacterium bins.59]|nr:DNA repair protein RecO [Leptolyngbyaceae cyanobacterium bins.59]